MRLIALTAFFLVLSAAATNAAETPAQGEPPVATPAAEAQPGPPPADAKPTDTAAPSLSPAPAVDAASRPDEAKLRAMVRDQATNDGLPPEVAEAVAEVESGFNTRAVGGVGEIGLMQVLPSTARMLGFSDPLPKLFEPENNIRYGVRYLAQAWKMTGSDICATVMKYRAGHGETRYSQRSVAYCLRVRQLLADRGFKVTGTVPVATFGEPAAASGVVRSGRVRIGQRLANGRVRMVFNWRQVDLRRHVLDKAGGASLRIAE